MRVDASRSKGWESLLAAAVFAAKYTSGVLRVRILKNMVSTAVVKRDEGGNVVSEKKVILVKTYKVPGKKVFASGFRTINYVPRRHGATVGR